MKQACRRKLGIFITRCVFRLIYTYIPNPSKQQGKSIENINETNTMLWKRNFELNTNVREDDKHV